MILDQVTRGHSIGPITSEQSSFMKSLGWVMPVVARDPWHPGGKNFPDDFRTDLGMFNKCPEGSEK